jgi:RNA polymerase sigma-70 factor (ECF subfamily)
MKQPGKSPAKNTESKRGEGVSNLDTELCILFEKSLAGDEVAYRQFLEQIAGVLRSFLIRSMHGDHRSKEKVEDLVQEVLFTVHKKRDLYRHGMPVIPWVRAIAKHRFIDTLRAESRRPAFTELTEQLENNFITEEIEPSHDVESLMACLDEKQMQILKLAKVDEIPHAEIASRLGISISLVKVTVHRSLQAIRKNFYEKN